MRPEVLDRNAGAMRQLADEAARHGFVVELTVLGKISRNLQFEGRLVLEVDTRDRDVVATATVADAALLHAAAHACRQQLQQLP